MILSKKSIANIDTNSGVIIPDASIFSLSEKVLQFGTGVLLRGLPDYFIDKANRRGIFNGRIVVVKSTAAGGTDAFEAQDGLFTLCVRGIDNDKKVEEAIINSSISRVLSAKDHWIEILKCAANPGMQIIISNTTEVGISLVENDSVNAAPPVSFPGKVLAFLWERYKIFEGNDTGGMVIIPTELILNNGTKLKEIVLELAKRNGLEENFINWLHTANSFCNSLVDRIVPGKLPDSDKENTEKRLGYTDDLMIMSESYRLWAIETSDKRTKDILSFSKADEGVVITQDIDVFRELKLRLLNGTHTFSCGLAFLSGFRTVKEAMDDEAFSAYITNLMMEEIAPAVIGEELSLTDAHEFSKKVLDRFRNPYIEHQWISITVQYSSKMKMRNVPIILKHYESHSSAPQYMAMGFAAYILFMKSEKNEKDQYVGVLNQRKYLIQDDHAALVSGAWKNNTDPGQVVLTVLKNDAFWGTDLSQLNDFPAAVTAHLESFIKQGALSVMQHAADKISM